MATLTFIRRAAIGLLLPVALAGAAPLGTAFTYQGRLTTGAAPATGLYDLRFTLFDAAADGNVVGVPVCLDDVSVVDGLFTTPLDFGPVFGGDQTFLQVDVRADTIADCADANGFVALAPRQALSSVPYALKVPGIDGHSLDAADGSVTDAVLVATGGNVAIGAITPTERLNVAGNIRVQNDGSLSGLDRLVGFNDLRLYGDAIGGSSGDVYISPAGSVGIGTSNPQAALHVVGAENNGATAGLRIDSPGQVLLLDGNEIDSSATLNLNYNTSNPVTIANGGGNVAIGNITPTARLNVAGSIKLQDDSLITGLDQLVGYNDLRFSGDATGGPDLTLGAAGNIGQRALYNNVSFNVRGDVFSGETQHFRVEDYFGLSILEVQSDHDVGVSGDFFVVNGSKDFVIDHPLDPANMSLAHNAVEGPGYYTHYHGNVVLGDDGAAWVELPAYFDALNTDPSYQLTCVGGYAPVYVAQEVSSNRFQIAGGRPGMKVSWQVHAARNDPYAKDHPYQAERPKKADEAGRYHYPKGYGAPPEADLARNAMSAEAP